MTDIFNDSIKAIKAEKFSAFESNQYKVVSVRPGEKVSAMIDVYAEINNNKLPLLNICDLISEELALFAQSRKEHIPHVLKAVDKAKGFAEGSAFDILRKNGNIKDVRERINFDLDLI